MTGSRLTYLGPGSGQPQPGRPGKGPPAAGPPSPPYPPHRTFNLPNSTTTLSGSPPQRGGRTQEAPAQPGSGAPPLLCHRHQHPSSHHSSMGYETEFKPVGSPLRVKGCSGDGELPPPGELATGTAHSPLGQRNVVVAEERRPVAKGQFPPKLLILRPPGDFWDGAVRGALYWTPRLGRLPWQRTVLG